MAERPVVHALGPNGVSFMAYAQSFRVEANGMSSGVTRTVVRPYDQTTCRSCLQNLFPQLNKTTSFWSNHSPPNSFFSSSSSSASSSIFTRTLLSLSSLSHFLTASLLPLSSPSTGGTPGGNLSLSLLVFFVIFTHFS